MEMGLDAYQYTQINAKNIQNVYKTWTPTKQMEAKTCIAEHECEIVPHSTTSQSTTKIYPQGNLFNHPDI
jgi:hypothetical protein